MRVTYLLLVLFNLALMKSIVYDKISPQLRRQGLMCIITCYWNFLLYLCANIEDTVIRHRFLYFFLTVCEPIRSFRAFADAAQCDLHDNTHCC